MEKLVIKFRAWDVEKSEMVYHGAFNFLQFPKMSILGPQELQQQIYPFDGIESGEMCTGEQLNGWYIMQFTGLRDKNGVDIYEGDMVKTSWLAELGFTEIDCEAIGLVEWDNCTCGFNISLKKDYVRKFGDEMEYRESHRPLLMFDEGFEDLADSYIVIGNIYQNPDLIK